ncbi:MAG: hypothetical protein LBG81_06740 [Coriobacteriaceae bacterium]|jgi:ABC-2 type transport system permease protein|nr:hypothetical protein [Coriobacteriaceae bacterium]
MAQDKVPGRKDHRDRAPETGLGEKGHAGDLNGFTAFLAKELTQILRTQRLLIVAVVFLLLGLMNAPLAKFTPEILELAGGSELASLGIILPEPTAFEAWAQFFSNVGQMGVLTILLVCGSALSGERKQGTLVLPLTKGLGRVGVVLVKFLGTSLLWTAGFLVAVFSSIIYTIMLFPGESVDNLVLGLASFWLFGEFLIALIPLSSTLVKGSMGGLVLPGGLLFLMLVLGSFPDLFFYSPMQLFNNGISVMSGESLDKLLVPALVAVGIALAALVAAVIRFRRVEL